MVQKHFKREVDLKYNFKVFWNFLSKYKWTFYFLIFIILVSEAVSFLTNFIFKYLVDQATLFSNAQIIVSQFSKVIIYSLIAYLIIEIIGALIWYLVLQLVNRLEANLMNDIENKSFWHVITLSYRFHLNRKTGSLISQFTRGVSKVESLSDAIIFNFMPTLFRIILSIGVIFYFDLITSLSLLVMIILFVGISIYLTYLQEEPQDFANDKEDQLKQNLSDTLINVETVKYFAKENRSFTDFKKISQDLREARVQFWNFFSRQVGLQHIILGLGTVAMIYFSFNSFLNGKMTLGSITLIYAAIGRLIPQLFGLMHGYRQFIRSGVDVSSLFAMFKERNEVVDIDNAPGLRVSDGEIEFEDVSFTYPKEKSRAAREATLRNFSLFIPKNSKVALVGTSGGGKTTVVKLLYRLFDLNSGRIMIDQQDVSKITQQSLRENMSIVPQEPILFNNTLYFNISYANPKASKEKVWEAIKFAQLDKLIERLPKKEKTIIGERGVKLSGGEKQRVSIARALLADKRILVLDEATSALDSETEKEIQGYLEHLMKNRTTIMIAHRLSTIMKADLIVVLDKGKIAEMGTHQELIQKSHGIYRKLWNIQRGKQE